MTKPEILAGLDLCIMDSRIMVAGLSDEVRRGELGDATARALRRVRDELGRAVSQVEYVRTAVEAMGEW